MNFCGIRVDGGGSCSGAIRPVTHAQAVEEVHSAAVGSCATPPQIDNKIEISGNRGFAIKVESVHCVSDLGALHPAQVDMFASQANTQSCVWFRLHALDRTCA